MKHEATKWQTIVTAIDPTAIPLPGVMEERVSPMQRLLCMRALRPDTFTMAVQKMVINALGPEFVKPPLFSVRACFEESEATIPVVIILSEGANPMPDLLKVIHAHTHRHTHMCTHRHAHARTRSHALAHTCMCACTHTHTHTHTHSITCYRRRLIRIWYGLCHWGKAKND